MDELRGLSRVVGRRGRQARDALAFASHNLRMAMDTGEHGASVDDRIVSYALSKKDNILVATLDTRLADRLKELRIPTIRMRSGRAVSWSERP